MQNIDDVKAFKELQALIGQLSVVPVSTTSPNSGNVINSPLWFYAFYDNKTNATLGGLSSRTPLTRPDNDTITIIADEYYYVRSSSVFVYRTRPSNALAADFHSVIQLFVEKA